MRTHADPHVAFRLLADAYTKPRQAVLRELITNAIDANAMVGSKTPVAITLPNSTDPKLVITDTGVGMSTGELENNFASIGRSTKTFDSAAIGRYGIGAKSPHALTDTFYVVSTKKGVTTSLTMNVSSDGAPNNEVTSVTHSGAPSGTTVIVPLPNVAATTRAGRDEWVTDAQMVCLAIDPGLIEFMPDDNGRVPVTHEHLRSQAVDDLSSPTVLYIERNWNTPRVIMGQIGYQLPQGFAAPQKNLSFMVPNGSMELTHTREHIKDTPENRECLQRAYVEWREYIFGELDKQWAGATTQLQRAVINESLSWNKRILFHADRSRADIGEQFYYTDWGFHAITYPGDGTKRTTDSLTIGTFTDAIVGKTVLLDIGSMPRGLDNNTTLGKLTVAARNLRATAPTNDDQPDVVAARAAAHANDTAYPINPVDVVVLDRAAIEKAWAFVNTTPQEQEAVDICDRPSRRVIDRLNECVRRVTETGIDLIDFDELPWVDCAQFIATNTPTKPTVARNGTASTFTTYLCDGMRTPSMSFIGPNQQRNSATRNNGGRTQITAQHLRDCLHLSTSGILVIANASNYADVAHYYQILIHTGPPVGAPLRRAIADAVVIADPRRSVKKLAEELAATHVFTPAQFLTHVTTEFLTSLDENQQRQLVDAGRVNNEMVVDAEKGYRRSLAYGPTRVGSTVKTGESPRLGHTGLTQVLTRHSQYIQALPNKQWARYVIANAANNRPDLPKPSATLADELPLVHELIMRSTTNFAMVSDQLIDTLYTADLKAAGSTRKRKLSAHA